MLNILMLMMVIGRVYLTSVYLALIFTPFASVAHLPSLSIIFYNVSFQASRLKEFKDKIKEDDEIGALEKFQTCNKEVIFIWTNICCIFPPIPGATGRNDEVCRQF